MSAWLLLGLHISIVAAVGLRVLWRSRPTSVSFAWMAVVGIAPLIGAIAYIVFGERFLKSRRARRVAKWQRAIEERYVPKGEGPAEALAAMHPAAPGIARLCRRDIGSAPIAGNRIALRSESKEIFAEWVREIDAAKASVDLEFYLASPGGAVDDVLDAVERAVRRGVAVRMLIDSLAGRSLLGSDRRDELEAAGVEVRGSLPIGLFSRQGARVDLRNHRKLLVIDDHLAFVGSQNLVDHGHSEGNPDLPAQQDAMMRIEGPAVAVLAAGFLADWELESDEPEESTEPEPPQPKELPTEGEAVLQIIRSGPADPPQRLLGFITHLLHSAQGCITICTPYFVPDDSVMLALTSAANRGVDVELLLPRKVDHAIVRWVGESFYQQLIDAGVHIRRIEDAFVHTKCIVIDNAIALFGSMNLDMRSLWLNFELAALVYGEENVAELMELVASYRESAKELDPKEWVERGFWSRLVENVARLGAPLL